MPCQSPAYLEENASVLHQSREDEDDTSDDPGFHGCQTLGLGTVIQYSTVIQR